MRDLKQIANDIGTQDNRGTASPMLILLQVRKEYVGHPDYTHQGEEEIVEQVSGDYRRFKTEDELLKWWNEGLDEDDLVKEVDDLVEGKDYDKFTMGYYWETENVFFTDKGYEEHMKINGHNYRKGQVRTYGIHAFRNEEMKQVLETIMAAR